MYLDSATPCGNEFEDDDGCGAGSTSSRLELPLTAGTYYLTVEPLNPGDCNDFVLEISAPCEADVPERPKGADDEPEACGADENGGCNADVPAFTPIECGQTYWGTGYYDGTTRDTDWYEVIITETTAVTLSGVSQSDFVFGVIDTGGSGNCDDAGAVSPFATTSPCLEDGGVTEYLVEAELTPGTWWFFAAPPFGDVVECGERDGYSFSLGCGDEPCLGDTNGDDVVDTADLVTLLADWGDCEGDCPADFNDDGVVDTEDLVTLLANWGPC
jgi:hypothetical protein